MQQIQDKAKKSCMVSFRILHSHLKLLSNNDLKGTRTECGFKRAFATLFGQDVESFTRTMFLNMDQLEKQLDNKEFQKIGSMVVFKVPEIQFQMFINSRIYLDDGYVIMTCNYFLQYTQLEIPEFCDTPNQHMESVKKSIDKRELHKREYDSWVNERQMQTTEEKVDTSKTLDASLVDTESNVIETINIELEHKVAKLLKENKTLKWHYKELYDSIKTTRAKKIEHTTSLIAENNDFKAQLQEKRFAIAALKNELRKLTENSVNTKFARTSILGKLVLQLHRNQSVVRQPTTFKSEQPRILKPWFASQVDVKKDLPQPVATHYFPRERESAFAKPQHMIAHGLSRFSSNDMVHNHYLKEAKKQTHKIGRNSKTSKCFFNANHDSCVKKFLNDVNLRAKVPSNKTTNRNKPVEQTSFAKKPKRQILNGHRFLIKKTFVVHEKTMTPRSCLKWKSTGKIFTTIGLKWVPTGKIFTSSTTKVDSEPINGLNEDITNQYKCEQTLDVSAGTLNLSAGTSFNPKKEGLRVCSELEIHDNNNEPSSSKLVPKVVPPANKAITSQQELELLFSPIHKLVRLGNSPIIQPEPDGSTQGYSTVRAVLSLDAGNPLYLQPNDHYNVPTVSFKLTGSENYKMWSTAMKYILKREFDIGTLLPSCTSAAHERVLKHNQLVTLMQFLIRFNDVYQPVRSNLLARDPLHDVKDAFAIVSMEESHRGLAPGKQYVKNMSAAYVFRTNNNNNNNNNNYRCVLYYWLGYLIFCLKVVLSLQVFTRDTYGDHVISCAGIIGIKHRHSVVRDTLVDICFRSGISTGKEVDIRLGGGCDKALRPANMLLNSWDGALDVCVDLIGSSPLTQTGMANFVPGRAMIDAAQRKRGKYMAKCAVIGYGFLPFSFSSLGKLEADTVTLLKRIHKFSMTQDIGARAAIHIFNRINFAIAKGVGAQIVSRLPSNLL
nr:actin-binding, cofilin/tropomyosin type [Tanacetum cinerariifolium]